MRKFPKIHGRPLLPWWVYVGYFLLGLFSVFLQASGAEMPTTTVKINEDSLAKAIVKAMRTYDKEQGRFGDTELAHVNPEEKEMLEARGGAGTRNPKTGMPEYFEADAYDGGTDRFGGSENDDRSSFSEGEARETGFYDGTQGPATDYSQYATATKLAEEDAKGIGAPTDPFSGSGTSTGGGLMDQITRFASRYPVSPTGLLAYGAAKGLGLGIGQPLNDLLGGSARAEAPQFEGIGQGPEGRNDQFMQQMAVQPGVTQAPAYMRPAQVEPPANLGLQGLSPLQQRTMMATYGSQGAQSQYRTPEAMRAYGNLIARSLIGDNNQVTGNEPGTLPIEDQYLRQVFGINKPNSAQSLLDALKPYWSQ